MTELTIQSTTKQKHLLEWSQRVADCRSSGLSVSRYKAKDLLHMAEEGLCGDD